MNLFDNVEKTTRIVKTPPSTNDTDILQFYLQPDKDCLLLSKTYIKFNVELSGVYIPDTGFFTKLFETMELTINSTHIGSRGSIYDLQQCEGMFFFKFKSFYKTKTGKK